MHLAWFFRIRTGFASLLFPCLLAWASGHTQPISRYALLVGIGPYAPESGWSRLHADEDARKWQALFLKNGFLPANCKTLLNKEATYTNIQIELKTLASHAEPGDQVVVYLGGHARKIQDHSGDEMDGWDEAFVPYDVPARWGTGAEEMPPYLCDDELGKWLGKIADKVTRMGSLLVVFDAGISEGKNLPVHSKGPLLPFRFPNPGQDKQANPTPHDNEWLDVSFTEERSQMITLDEGPDAGCAVHEVPYGPAGKPLAWGSRLTQTFVAAVSKNPGIRFRELSANPLSKPAGGGGCPIRIDGAIQLPVFKPNPEGQASPNTEAQAETNSGSVFLFTIGVSRYQNVDPLNFAHADAGLFHGLIQSVYPGGIPEDNQFLFLDSLATIKPIIDGLESINNRLKAGDKVYFYFAGHGDVENLLSRKAHLLLYNSPANVYKAGGTLPVEDIKDYFQQWIYKKARVFLVVDACRSGKLAGGFEGRDAALASLQEVNTQSARLLSCQPNEKSEESSIFGGGHGAFTYFLVKGLSGAANQNGDQKITIDEIGRFLQDSVA